MTADQVAQLQRIKAEFAERVQQKYPAGAKEHGGYLGDLTELALVEHAIDEVVDQFCYLSALREKLLARQARAMAGE
jgi:hypothetical protein